MVSIVWVGVQFCNVPVSLTKDLSCHDWVLVIISNGTFGVFFFKWRLK